MGSADAIYLNSMFGNVHDQVRSGQAGARAGGAFAPHCSTAAARHYDLCFACCACDRKLCIAPPSLLSLKSPNPNLNLQPQTPTSTSNPNPQPQPQRYPNPNPQHYSLARAAQLLKPGGYAVISHQEGRAWHAALRGSSGPGLIPHELPDRAGLDRLLSDSAFELVEFVDDAHLYMAVLRVRVWLVGALGGLGSRVAAG